MKNLNFKNLRIKTQKSKKKLYQCFISTLFLTISLFVLSMFSFSEDSAVSVTFYANKPADATGDVTWTNNSFDGSFVISNIPGESPVLAGYKFIGWGTAANSTVPEYQPGSTITGDVTSFYAVWEKQVLVTFYDTKLENGVSTKEETSISSSYHNNGADLTFPNPTTDEDLMANHTNQVFVGWVCQIASKPIYQPGESYKINNKDGSELEVWAVWEDKLTVSFDISNIPDAKFKADLQESLNKKFGSENVTVEDKKVTISGIKPGSKMDGGDVSSYIDLDDTKCEFVSWDPSFETIITQDADYKARYKTIVTNGLEDITLTYDQGFDSTEEDPDVSVPSPQGLSAGETSIAINGAPTSRNGYSFVGWKLQSKKAGSWGDVGVEYGNENQKFIQPGDTLQLKSDATSYPQITSENQILDSNGDYYPLYLVAQWKEDITVTYHPGFDDDGETELDETDVENIPDVETCSANTTSIEISDNEPSRNGYSFVGWKLCTKPGEDFIPVKSNGEDVVLLAGDTIDLEKYEDIKDNEGDYYPLYLVAQWKEDITVTYHPGFDDDGETELDETDVENIPDVETCSANTTSIEISDNEPSRNGYSFVGWKLYTKPGEDFIPVKSDDEDVVLLAGDTINLEGYEGIKDSNGDYCQLRLVAQWGDMYYIRIIDPISGEEIESLGPLSPDENRDLSKWGTGIGNIPSKPGYKFVGITLTEGSQEPQSDIIITIKDQDVNVYVIWKKLHEITYDANSPTGETVTNMPSDITIESGDTITLNSEGPVCDGYRFTGWNTKDDGSGTPYDSSNNWEIEVTDDITLYAQWEKDITVTYHQGFVGAEEDLDVPVPDSQASSAGEESININDMSPSRDGYSFVGWKLCTKPGDDFTPVKSNGVDVVLSAGGTIDLEKYEDIKDNEGDYYPLYLVAQWKEHFKVVFKDKKDNAIQTLYFDVEDGKTDTFVIPDHTDTEIDPDDFGGWELLPGTDAEDYFGKNIGRVSAGTKLTLETSDIKNGVTITFKPVSKSAYTVTYVDDDGESNVLDSNGDRIKDDNEYKRSEGFEVSDSAPYKADAKFLGWKVTSGVNLYDLLSPGTEVSKEQILDGDKVTLKAVWEYYYTVTYKYEVNGENVLSDISVERYAAGELVTVDEDGSIEERLGTNNSQLFDNWSYIDSGGDFGSTNSGGTFIMPDKNVTIEPVFTSGYSVVYKKGLPEGSTDTVTNMPPQTDWSKIIASETEYDLKTYNDGDSDIPTRSGYKFAGWVAESGTTDGVANADAPTVTTVDIPSNGGEINVYAKWNKIFKVTYKCGEGHESITVTDETEYVKGDIVVVRQAPECENEEHKHEFKGWMRSDNGETVVPGSTFTIDDGDVELVAQWGDMYYIRIIDPISSKTIESLGPFAPGQSEDLSNWATQKPGYKFVGLSLTKGNDKPDDNLKITIEGQHVNVYVIWKELHEITYDANAPEGEASHVPPGETDIESGETITLNSEGPVCDGYLFMGWNTQADGLGTSYDSSNNWEIEVTSNIKLYAQWEEIPAGTKYIRFINVDTGVTLENGLPDDYPLYENEKVNLSGLGEPISSTHSFDGWLYDGTKVETISYNQIDGNQATVYATWKEKEDQTSETFNITFDKNCDVEVDNMPSDIEHSSADGDFELPAGPKRVVDDGYIFNYWSVDKDAAGAIYNAGGKAKITGNTTFFAIWGEKSTDTYPTLGISPTLGASGGDDNNVSSDGDDSFVMGDSDSSSGDGSSSSSSPIPDPVDAQESKKVTIQINHNYYSINKDGVKEVYGIDTDIMEINANGDISIIDSHGDDVTDSYGDIDIDGVVDADGNINIYKFICTNFKGLDFVYVGSSLDDDGNMILNINEIGENINLLSIDLNYDYKIDSEGAVYYQVKHEYYQSEDPVTNTLDGVLSEKSTINKALDIDIDELIKLKYTDKNNIEREYKYLSYTTKDLGNTYSVVIKYVRSSSYKQDLSISGVIKDIRSASYKQDLSISGDNKTYVSKSLEQNDLNKDLEAKENQENKDKNKDINTVSDDLVDTGLPAVPCLIIILASIGSILIKFGVAKKNKIS